MNKVAPIFWNKTPELLKLYVPVFAKDDPGRPACPL